MGAVSEALQGLGRAGLVLDRPLPTVNVVTIPHGEPRRAGFSLALQKALR
jgi:hypothetical protein